MFLADQPYNFTVLSRKPIGYRELESGGGAGDPLDGVAIRYDPSRRVMLRFRLEISEPDDVDALRYARRAMIREERRRGLEWDEPTMDTLTFSPQEIRWFVLASQGAWCREKVAILIERANRARKAPEAEGPPPEVSGS